MLVEAIPRLAAHLRTVIPEAQIELENQNHLVVSPSAFPEWRIQVSGKPVHDEFQILQTSLDLEFESLSRITDSDFNRLIATENFGLRGVTLLKGEGSPRRLRIRTGFLGQMGRTLDEMENTTIDILSTLRFARLLKDRIQRSSAGGDFSIEMYHSMYIVGSRGWQRHINSGRSFFKGSTERFFGQLVTMLQKDHKCQPTVQERNIAKVQLPNSDLEIVMRVPEEMPIISFYTPIQIADRNPSKIMATLEELNRKTDFGHFEATQKGSLISFVTWKHLTNDLRYFSLDHLITSTLKAEELLRLRLSEKSRSNDRADRESEPMKRAV